MGEHSSLYFKAFKTEKFLGSQAKVPPLRSLFETQTLKEFFRVVETVTVIKGEKCGPDLLVEPLSQRSLWVQGSVHMCAHTHTHVCRGVGVGFQGGRGLCPTTPQEHRWVSPRDPMEAGTVHCGFESLGGELHE